MLKFAIDCKDTDLPKLLINIKQIVVDYIKAIYM